MITWFIYILSLLSSYPVFTANFPGGKVPYINTAFQSGEELYFDVAYGWVKGGEASMTIDLVPVGYDYMYHVKAEAHTTGMFALFSPIQDTYETYIHMLSGLPIKAIRNIRENNYTYYNELLFFRQRHFIRSLNSGDHPAPDNTLDILSAFYFARRHLFSHNLEKNQIISLFTFFDDQFLDIRIKYKGKEMVRTRFGKVRCMKFVPDTTNNKTFTKEKQLQIWVTDDRNFVPVKIKAHLPIGSLKCALTGYKGLKDPEGQLRNEK
ncbi:MAG TPA: DUF3108 domain-containing protein [Bacteroidetes bacterium]|nr:DUF3108 domain-containing protein [Bacteroidota bacterium]